MFEGFIEVEMSIFCTTEVETFDSEADQPQIIAIINYLDLGVEINSVRDTGKIDKMEIPEDGDTTRFRVKLLFTPGHYDSLYA